MKKLAIAFLACWAVAQADAAQLHWMTSLPKAQAKAKAEHKLVMMDFTGSDWCPYCIRLKKNVLSSPEFTKYAKEHLVLVEVDFPHRKQQSAEVKQANQELAQKYGIGGFPTIVILNSEGKKVTSVVGYDGSSPSAYIAQLKTEVKAGLKEAS
jgi:thioredoxin-related protein